MIRNAVRKTNIKIVFLFVILISVSIFIFSFLLDFNEDCSGNKFLHLQKASFWSYNGDGLINEHIITKEDSNQTNATLQKPYTGSNYFNFSQPQDPLIFDKIVKNRSRNSSDIITFGIAFENINICFYKIK